MPSTLHCFVLAGGRSTRFGSNKSIALIDGIPMARRVANNLFDATKVQPQLLGGDDTLARALGLESLRGQREGNGPLGAIIDALELSKSDVVLFAPNDTPYFSSDDFIGLLSTLDTTESDVAVARDDVASTGFHWLLSAWRSSSCLQHLSEQYSNGIRSIYEAVVGLDVSTLACKSESLRNINYSADMIIKDTI